MATQPIRGQRNIIFQFLIQGFKKSWAGYTFLINNGQYCEQYNMKNVNSVVL